MTVRQVEHRQRLLLFLGRLRREGSERCRGGDSGQTELCGRPWAHLECSLVLAGPLDTEVAQGILAALQVVLRFPRRLVVIGVGAWRDLPLDQVLDVLAAGEAHVRDGLDLEGRADDGAACAPLARRPPLAMAADPATRPPRLLSGALRFVFFRAT